MDVACVLGDDTIRDRLYMMHISSAMIPFAPERRDARHERSGRRRQPGAVVAAAHQRAQREIVADRGGGVEQERADELRVGRGRYRRIEYELGYEDGELGVAIAEKERADHRRGAHDQLVRRLQYDRIRARVGLRSRQCGDDSL